MRKFAIASAFFAESAVFYCGTRLICGPKMRSIQVLGSSAMKSGNLQIGLAITIALSSSALAQSAHEAPLCEAARTSRVVEIVYDKDVSKGCLSRLVDVHQVAIGNNGKLYMHGWQERGCTKGRDYASERIFRLDKIKAVQLIEGVFNEKSRSIKLEGWDGCIGSNCFVKENICE